MRNDDHESDGEFGDERDAAVNRPRASSGRHEGRAQFTYSSSRKNRPTTHFNGIHRRAKTRWNW
ncbi:MAG: hypothetical protein K8T25_09835 [Planctomycetia bacterium]|nr:hypothetical protein [Planctomycetia bacterium]